MNSNGSEPEAYTGPERRKVPFTHRQLLKLEEVIDIRLERKLAPMTQELQELMPFIRSQKQAHDSRAKFWEWMWTQAQDVAQTNVKYAINAILWFAFMVIVLGVTGVWKRFWPFT